MEGPKDDQKPLPMPLVPDGDDTGDDAGVPAGRGVTFQQQPRPGIQWNNLLTSVFDFFDPNRASQQGVAPGQQQATRRRTTTGGGDDDFLIPLSDFPDFNSDSEEGDDGDAMLAGDLGDSVGGETTSPSAAPGRKDSRFSLPRFGSHTGLRGVSRGSGVIEEAAEKGASSNQYSDEEDDDDFFHDAVFQDALDEIGGLEGDGEGAEAVDPLLLIQVVHKEMAQEQEEEEIRKSFGDYEGAIPVVEEGDEEDEEGEGKEASKLSEEDGEDEDDIRMSQRSRKSSRFSAQQQQRRSKKMSRGSSLSNVNLQRARNELLDSERTYYGRLNILIDGFKQPLLDFINLELQRSRGALSPTGASASATSAGQSAAASSSASSTGSSSSGSHDKTRPTSESAKLVHILFGNVEQLRDLAKQLLEELNEAVKKEEHIGPVFVRFAPLLKIYSEYYINHRKAREALELLKREYWFHCFVTACEMQPHCQGLLLRDFLIEPVQRVPRYEILLRSMLKYTRSQGSGYHDQVYGALKTVRDVLESLNQGLSEKDRREQVAILSESWGVAFTAPHRSFLKSGNLVKTDRRGQRRRYTFLLFNDLLVYGEELPRRFFGIVNTAGYKLHFKAPLQSCIVITEAEVYSCLGKQDIGMLEKELMDSGELGTADRPAPPASMSPPPPQPLSPSRAAASSASTVRARTLSHIGIRLERVKNTRLDSLSFMVEVPGKALLLTAKNEADRSAWLSAFENAFSQLGKSQPTKAGSFMLKNTIKHAT